MSILLLIRSVVNGVAGGKNMESASAQHLQKYPKLYDSRSLNFYSLFES
jgi:hypothetical protein